MEMPKFDAKDVEDSKVIAALSYVWILFLVPLIVKKDSPFAKWHAKQGLVLFIAEIIGMIVGWIPLIGWLIGFVVFIFAVVVSIIGILKALGGEGYEVPVIGKYAEQIKI
jgi:uncharacterized membrane protein